jgi:hypothetical protein
VTGVRGLPATPAGWFSHCAARYFATYDAGREDLARIAVKNHHNGTLAPKSMLKREVTVEEVLAARIISWPFGLYDCAAQSDGAAAAIITRRELAKGFRDDFVLVRAIAIALAPDPKEDPDFDFLRWKPTVYAARQAYAQAGITQPRKEIDLAQVHDCFTLTELLAYEDLGFCEKGAAKEHIRGAAGQHRRRLEDLRTPDGCDGRPHDLRELQAASGQGGPPSGEEPHRRAQPQHRGRATGLRHLHRGAPLGVRRRNRHLARGPRVKPGTSVTVLTGHMGNTFQVPHDR